MNCPRYYRTVLGLFNWWFRVYLKTLHLNVIQVFSFIFTAVALHLTPLEDCNVKTMCTYFFIYFFCILFPLFLFSCHAHDLGSVGSRILASINHNRNQADCVTQPLHWNNTDYIAGEELTVCTSRKRYFMARLFAFNTGGQSNSGNTSWLSKVNTRGRRKSENVFLHAKALRAWPLVALCRNVQKIVCFF